MKKVLPEDGSWRSSQPCGSGLDGPAVATAGGLASRNPSSTRAFIMLRTRWWMLLMASAPPRSWPLFLAADLALEGCCRRAGVWFSTAMPSRRACSARTCPQTKPQNIVHSSWETGQCFGLVLHRDAQSPRLLSQDLAAAKKYDIELWN